MNVQEMFSLCDFEGVWRVMERCYYGNVRGKKRKRLEKVREEYAGLFEKLKTIETEPNGEHGYAVLTAYPDLFSEEEGGEGTVYDCSYYAADNRENFSMLFIPWAKVMGAGAAPYSINEFGPEAFAAHLLYEITFIGMDEEVIEKEKAALTAAAEDARERLGRLKADGKDVPSEFVSFNDWAAKEGFKLDAEEAGRMRERHERCAAAAAAAFEKAAESVHNDLRRTPS